MIFQIAPPVVGVEPIMYIVYIIGFLLVTQLPLIIKTIKEKKDNKNNSGINHHKNCPYFGDNDFYETIKPFITQAIDRAVKVFDIKQHQTLECQMNLVDRSIIKIKSILIKDYMEINDQKRDRRFYTMLLNYTLNICKEQLKEWVKENHLLERTDEEFRNYVEETAVSIQDLHIQQLNELYHSEDFDVGREQLFKHNKENNISIIKEEIEDLLYKIRNIAKEKQDEIKEIENE
jgi:hypothetical protein